MIQDDIHTKALDVFIRYGFRKTSMDDIAAAVGLSRQALYKRHGNKEALFNAVVDASVTQYFADAHAALAQAGVPIRQRFFDACTCSAGEYIDKMRSSPHSYEVIAMANWNEGDLAEALHTKFQEAAVDLLLDEGVFQDEDQARSAFFVIQCASNGLFHEAKDQEEYRDGMDTVIRTVIPANSEKK